MLEGLIGLALLGLAASVKRPIWTVGPCRTTRSGGRLCRVNRHGRPYQWLGVRKAYALARDMNLMAGER